MANNMYTPKQIASIITEDPNIRVQNVHLLNELKTEKGPWGGGNKYDQDTADKEFKDLSSKSLKKKDLPEKSKELKLNPGDGAKGAGIKEVGKVAKPEGFNTSKLPFKSKEEPKKSTTNSDTTPTTPSIAPTKAVKSSVYSDSLINRVDRSLDMLMENDEFCPDCITPDENACRLCGGVMGKDGTCIDCTADNSKYLDLRAGKNLEELDALEPTNSELDAIEHNPEIPQQPISRPVPQQQLSAPRKYRRRFDPSTRY